MILNLKYKKFNSAKSFFFTFIQRNNVTILILILFCVWATKIIYKDLQFSPDKGIPSAESRLNADFANDFHTSVYFRASQMLKGQEMNVLVIHPGYVDSASGQLFPLLFSPFLNFFHPDRYVSYFFFLCTTLIIFIIFYTLLMKKNEKEILNGGLIFLFAFFLSVPGFIGIYMGNIDIILAPIVGILVLLVLGSIKKEKISIIRIIITSILAGAMINAKIFLLLFALITVFFSKRKFLTGIVAIATFFTLIYIPNIFSSQSSPFLFFNKIINWDNLVPFSNNLWANHSLYATATIFTDCVKTNTCETQPVNALITLALFLFIFLTPFLLYKPIKKITINKNIYFSVMKLRKSKEFALVLIVLAVAFINLAFKVVYDYRLFYSVIITLILLKESAAIKKATVYCYLSMFSLLIGGIWALRLSPDEPWTIDARPLKFFIIFHFFFLILSALTYWKESQKKQL